MRYFFAAVILIFSTGRLMAADIISSDFARGYYLEVDKKSVVYSIELPEDVYYTVKSADLRDVRVFNGAGEVVPHEFRSVGTPATTLRDKKNIPYFPLFESNAQKDPTGFSLQVSRDTAGAIVNIKSAPASDKNPQEITGYLLDLSGQDQALSELEFYWQKNNDSSVFTVNIEQSSDLMHWIPLVYSATLADLQFGGQQVEKRTINLSRQPLQYLKLTWQESRWPLKLTEVTSYSRIIEARREHRWISLYNGVVIEKNNQVLLDFETNYKLPISSLQVRFPETNSIALLSIQSRAASDAEWNTRCEQVFYDLSFEGTALRNVPCDFPSTADSMWRIVVMLDGAGLGSDKRKVTLQLGWRPSELIFIGRGTPPYLLAFGSGKIAQEDKDSSAGMLMMAIQLEKPPPLIGSAKLGKRINLGGDMVLQSPVKPPPWKKWLLWAVLLFGVGGLAFMARSLVKEMKIAEENKMSQK